MRAEPRRPATSPPPGGPALRHAPRPPAPPLAAVALALALAASPVAGPAGAQGVSFDTGGPDEPVEVTAERLSIERETGIAVFEGDVVVGQGPLRLAAERVEVEYGEGGRVARLTATGGVTLASGEDAAEAQEATYAVEAGEIVLSGEVVLTQGTGGGGAPGGGAGGATLAADRLRVDLATGRAELDGRVRTILPVGD